VGRRSAFSNSANRTTLPKPRFHTVRDTAKGANAVKFFEYWRDVPDDKVDLVEVRVYRLLPIVDVRLVDPNRKTVEWDLFKGKIPFDPEEYIDQSFHRWGSGEWRFVLTEIGVPGEIMECYFCAIDYDRYWPKFDLRMLVKGHFKNEDFIRQCQSRNIRLPWEEDSRNDDRAMIDEEEMQIANEALKSVTASHERLTDKTIELAEKVADARVEAAASHKSSTSVSPEMEAARAAVGLVTDTSKQMFTSLAESSSKGFDPVAMLKGLSEFTGSRADNGMGQMFTMVMDMNNRSQERLQELQDRQFQIMMKALNEPAATTETTAVVAASSPRGFIDQLREMKDTAELLGITWNSNRGGATATGSNAVAPRKGFWDGFGETLSQNPMALTGIISGVTTGLALLANVVWNFTKPKEERVSPEEAVKVAQTTTQAQQPVQTQAQTQQPGPTPDQQLAMFMSRLEPALLAHFFGDVDGLDGHTFADYILSNFTGHTLAATPDGERIYREIRERMGPANFDRALRSYAPIWTKIAAFAPENEGGALGPDGKPKVGYDPSKNRYIKFLNEFFTHMEWLRTQQEPETVGGRTN
jgi:hypothetical protein